MKRPELYKKTVDILFNAYFNDMLRHGFCGACAVGNIIKANVGIVSDNWYYVIEEKRSGRSSQIADPEIARTEINSTGYTINELAKIEAAFEGAPGWKEDYMFNGLVAVLEVLKEIHEVGEEEAAAAAQPFRNHYAQKQTV